jgi:hypothetical protein
MFQDSRHRRGAQRRSHRASRAAAALVSHFMATPSSTAPDGIALLSPAALPKVLGEALLPGVRVVSLMNRSGLLLGCAGDAQAAPAISAIVSSLWQNFEKCDGSLGCLLLECERGRLAVKAVGSFVLAICGDSTVPFGLLKAKVVALTSYLLPQISQLS